MTGFDFPEGFQGSGPMFAAVDLGDPWYNLAAVGTDTYIPHNSEFESDPDLPGSAFLDRADAEAVADASSNGVYDHWHGLSGRVVMTPAPQQELARESAAEWEAWARMEADPEVENEAERRAEYAAEWETEPEWDDADSNRYQARVEAETEPEAGL